MVFLTLIIGCVYRIICLLDCSIRPPFVHVGKIDLLCFVQVTAEHESGIRIWDLRKPKVPIQELPGHTHWYLSCIVLKLIFFFYLYPLSKNPIVQFSINPHVEKGKK